MTSIGFGFADPSAGFRRLFDISSKSLRNLPLMLGGSSLGASDRWDNEALQILDAVTGAIVEEPPRSDPPAAAAVGAGYIVGPASTGAWIGKEGQIATMSPGGWRFVAPADGLSALVRSNRLRAEYFAGSWEIGVTRTASVEIGGEQLLSAPAGAIAPPTGGATVDVQARTAIDQLLTALRGHGLIAE